MLEAEAVVVKGGVLILATLSVIRIVWNDFNNLMADFREKEEPLKPRGPKRMQRALRAFSSPNMLWTLLRAPRDR